MPKKTKAQFAVLSFFLVQTKFLKLINYFFRSADDFSAGFVGLLARPFRCDPNSLRDPFRTVPNFLRHPFAAGITSANHAFFTAFDRRARLGVNR